MAHPISHRYHVRIPLLFYAESLCHLLQCFCRIRCSGRIVRRIDQNSRHILRQHILQLFKIHLEPRKVGRYDLQIQTRKGDVRLVLRKVRRKCQYRVSGTVTARSACAIEDAAPFVIKICSAL